ncbi:hypothetical protein J6590_103454 [Homalodisca vitripennis]|nr:hypothetical protein J6590_103454 [Homalodisca vitripennis]
MDSCIISPAEKGKGRKKKADPENWKRTIAKRQRHKSKKLPNMPYCSHKGNKTFGCKSLRMGVVKEFHDNFYKETDKAIQDSFILKYIRIRQPARRRCSKENSSKKATASVNEPAEPEDVLQSEPDGSGLLQNSAPSDTQTSVAS